MKPTLIFQLFRKALAAWKADRVPQMGAALAYYSAFSLAPLMILTITLAGMVFEKEATKGGIERELEALVGKPAAAAIEDVIKNAGAYPRSGLWAIILSVFALFWAGSSVFRQL